MEQQDNVTISVNEYESSASLANTLTKRVRIGAKSVEKFEKTCDSISNSSVSFKVPISDQNLLSRRLVFEFPISCVIDSGADGAHMRNVYLNPRADLNRIFSSISVKVNGSSIVSQPQTYAEIVQNFSKESEHYHNGGVLSSNPVVPDILYSNGLDQYTGSATNRPDNTTLGGMEAYHFRTQNYDMSYPSRAAVSNFRKVGVTDAVNAGDRAVGFTYFVRVALKHDFLSSSALETLSNIQDLEVQITFNQAYIKQKLFHMCIPYTSAGALTDAAVSANLGTLKVRNLTVAPNQLFDFELSPTDFKLIGMVINPSNQDIPELSLVPAQSYLSFDYPIGSVNDTVSQTVIHTNINLSQVPSYMFLSVIPQESDLSIFRSDYFAPITNLNVQINNRSYPFELWTERDFYQMNCENGYKGMYSTFNSSKLSTKYGNMTGAYQHGEHEIGTGAPLCFRLASNFGGELKESLNENFRVEIRYTVTNTSGVALNLTSRVNFVQDTVFVCQRGSGVRQLNGVSKEEFAEAISRGSYVTLGMDDKDEEGGLMGGGNFSNMFRDAGRGLIRFMNVGNQILKSAAELYPETGLGQAAFEANRANALAQSLNQNLNLGAGMMGGSRLDMLRASGVLR